MASSEEQPRTPPVTEEATATDPPEQFQVPGTVPSQSKEDACGGGSSNGGVSTSLPGDVDEEEEEAEEEENQENSLAVADELYEKGSKAIEDNNLAEAVEYCSRTLEIRVAHYGELAPECVTAYYKYGCALLFKAQEESDPLGNVPKASKKNSSASKSAEGSTSSKAPSVDDEGEELLNVDDQGEGEEVSEDVEDEEDSDLDLAWKMLDIARAIDEKCNATLQTVKTLSALGEASLEREDFETSLTDYHKALSILNSLEEPDHRRAIELNFRICLVFELASRIEEAVLYCEKATGLCKSRLQRLMEENTKIKESISNSEEIASSNGTTLSKKEEEIEAIRGFQSDLEKKLEDLQQALSNPKPDLSEITNKSSTKCTADDKSSLKMEDGLVSSNSTQDGEVKGTFDSPSVPSATNCNVTHLGVVGRGIKRATILPMAAEPDPKRPSLDLSGNGAETSESMDLTSASQDTETTKLFLRHLP